MPSRLTRPVTLLTLIAATQGIAHAALVAVDPGPYPNAEFVSGYQDTHGRVLDLCLTKALNSRVVVFPTNFPEEAFWTGALKGDIGPFLRSVNGPYTETNPATGTGQYIDSANQTVPMTESTATGNWYGHWAYGHQRKGQGDILLIDQKGQLNSGDVWQDTQSDSRAELNQNGTPNTINLTQNAQDNLTQLKQNGTANDGKVAQAENFNELFFEQNGSDNVLIADQRGGDNYAQGSSYGVGNTVDFTQSGTGNQAYTTQDGDDNLASIKQADGNIGVNLAYVNQTGSLNQAYVDQSNQNMNANVQQIGSGNQASVVQK